MMTWCGRTYVPSLDDVGAYLALYWVPVREDGKRGKPLVAVCDNPVAPGNEGFTFVLSFVLKYYWKRICFDALMHGGHYLL